MPPHASSKQLTHFLCIPLVTSTSRPQLQAALQLFSSDIKSDRTPENPSGIPEKAIRPVGTVHLTLGVMSLVTPERIESAITLLKGLDLASMLSNASRLVPSGISQQDVKDTVMPMPLKITLRGLASMHQPSKTSTLYAKPVDLDGRLQRFCNSLQKVFAEAEILVPDTRPLLLHATIVNTIYVPGVRDRSGKATGHGKRKSKMTIDAREILDRYEEFTWMEDVRVEKVAICKMGAKKVVDDNGTEDEKYIEEAEVELPSVEMHEIVTD